VSRRAWILFGAMAVIWGIPYLLIKVAVRDLDPAALVFARTAIGAVILLPVAIARRELRPVLARWRVLIAYTVVELAVPWVLLSDAERRLSSSLSGLLVAAVPLVGAVMVLVGGRRLDREGSERVTATRLAGLLCGMAGVAALLGLDVRAGDLRSVLEVAVVVVGYALGPMIAARRLSDVPPLGVVAASLGLCALAYLPVALTETPGRVPGARVLAAVVVLGVVCTAVAFVTFFALIAEAGPTRATLITYLNPAVAVVLGVAFLGEGFGVGAAVGFALILTGCWLATRRGGAVAAGREGPVQTAPPEAVDRR
jgi:drug/metabolite transporter (DMT)-like permease